MPGERVKCNLNDIVFVKLTPLGEATLEKEFPGSDDFRREHDGSVRFHLHELMFIFGHLFNGWNVDNAPFEKNTLEVVPGDGNFYRRIVEANPLDVEPRV